MCRKLHSEITEKSNSRFCSSIHLDRLGFTYNKRRNLVELAVERSATDSPDAATSGKAEEQSPKNAPVGWPGYMSVRMHELDGMFDHPTLAISGEPYQVLDLQCHSKLAGRRVQRPKKGAKGDVTDEAVDAASSQKYEPMSVPSCPSTF